MITLGNIGSFHLEDAMQKKTLFSGTFSVEAAPSTRDHLQQCAVCERPIPFFGIRVKGEIANIKSHEQKVARWRLGAGSYLEGDPELAEREVPETNPVDIFVDDVLCLAILLRNSSGVNTLVVP